MFAVGEMVHINHETCEVVPGPSGWITVNTHIGKQSFPPSCYWREMKLAAIHVIDDRVARGRHRRGHVLVTEASWPR